jgi:DNA processing protein
MSTEADRLARARLAVAYEPGDARVLDLARHVGAQALVEAMLAEGGEPRRRVSEAEPERALETAARSGVRFVIPSDDEWPAALDDLGVAPPLQERGGVPLGLWVRGPLRLDELAGSVAIVGSRHATTYGAEVTGEIAAAVARAGRAVVSGAAFGVDQAAHRGAVAVDGQTAAVLACGADRVYPQTHRALIEHIAAVGAVVSETQPGGAPMKVRFLSRNRLIAALSVGTVVVEAAARSGALNTANWAERLNRHLMGVPGPVTSASSVGVHALLRSGAATLVTRGAEVLEVVAAAGEHLAPVPRGPVRPLDRVSLADQRVLDAVPVHTAAPAGSIARVAGTALPATRDALARLRLAGLVERDRGCWRLAAEADQ